MNTPYENLANAIVLSAVQDYRKALRILSRFPERRDALKEKHVTKCHCLSCGLTW